MTFIWPLLLCCTVVLLVAVLRGFLLPLHVHYVEKSTPIAAQGAAVPVADADEPFVGLALSGGGARAAIFAAAGMQALAERGLLQTVTHVSSVSGGGFAASYFALYPVPATDSGLQAQYFAKMHDVLAHNFFRDIHVNQARYPLRLFSPSRRLLSFQEALDRPDFLNAATFASLPAERAFYFNAVSYDTGRRFIFSNASLPPPDAKGEHLLPPDVRALSFSNARDMRQTPADVPLSLAIATSAGFPPYLGPTTLAMDMGADKKPEYWHLGDGGVLENSGVETLRDAVYAAAPKTPAIIYAFNAGKRLDQDLSKNTLDISIWSRDASRIIDVLLEYSGALRDTMFRELDQRTGIKITVVEFNYLDVATLVSSDDKTWTSWSAWPSATQAHRLDSKTPADHLAKIPTALKISTCDRALIAQAARFLVQYKSDNGLM